MAMDPFTGTLAGFRQWADTTPRKLAGDPVADASELLTLFRLMREELELERPADLAEGQLEELLLGIYPRRVAVLGPEDVEDTVPALRDLLSYLAERGEVADATAHALERELDRAAPRFADAVGALPDWDLFGEDEADTDVKEAFGLPDQLPPMRLPPAAELAEAARRAPMMGHLQALAEWAGEGRPVTDTAELADPADAAAALGVELPYLDYLRWLALDTGFLELDEDETHALAGEEAQAWRDSDDDEAVDIWETVFALVLDALDVAASLDPRRARELDFAGHGTGLAVTLFLTRAEGLPVTAASEVIRESAVGGLPQDNAAKAWGSWVRAHGDPARLLLDRLAKLGAVRISDGDDGERAWLTPLGLAAVRTELTESGVDIPLLPDPSEMTAADLLAMADGVSEAEFDTEAAAWQAHRTPESAARELLAAAAQSDPATRMLAVAMVTELGAPAEPAWRDALGQPELRGYAKTTLLTLAGISPEADAPPGLEPTEDDLAWMLIDTLVTDGWGDLDDVAEDDELDPAELAARLGEAVPPGQELVAFEMLARAPHPDAAGVLTVIGRYHPDKRVAKLARKSAYKAASRRRQP